MTVRQLVTLLAAYPPDAEVGIIVIGQDGFPLGADILAVGSEQQVLSLPGQSGVTIEDAPLEHGDNPYRRGALEQLFDSCSTGIDNTETLKENATTIRVSRYDSLKRWSSMFTDFAEMTKMALDELHGDWPPSDETLRQRLEDRFGSAFDDWLLHDEDGLDVMPFPNEFDENDALNAVLDLAMERAHAALAAM